MKIQKQGQAMIEYSILIIIVAAVFLTMQIYLKRGFQGKWKSSMDEYAEQYDPSTTNMETNYVVISNATSTIFTVPGVDPGTGDPGVYTNRVDATQTVETKRVNSLVGPP